MIITWFNTERKKNETEKNSQEENHKTPHTKISSLSDGQILVTQHTRTQTCSRLSIDFTKSLRVARVWRGDFVMRPNVRSSTSLTPSLAVLFLLMPSCRCCPQNSSICNDFRILHRHTAPFFFVLIPSLV